MKHSTDRILTTHAGSLPRPPDLLALIERDGPKAFDTAAAAQRLTAAVGEIVHKQIDLGVDVVDDGEYGKPSFVSYINERLGGYEVDTRAGPRNQWATSREGLSFPEFYSQTHAASTHTHMICTGPITYKGHARLKRDIDNFKAALKGAKVEEAFMPAISPSNIEDWQKNAYYKSTEDYIFAIADAMHEEYKAIVDAGFLVQIDDPRLVTYYIIHPEASIADCRKWAEIRVEALNHALRDIPPEKIRFHTCYGINMGPRIHDMELKDIVDIILKDPRRRLFVRGRQSAPRARMESVEGRQAARRQDSDPRRDLALDHPGRASRARRRANRALRQRRRPRKRHRRFRLRLRHLRRVEGGASVDRLGKVQGAQRRRAHCVEGTVGLAAPRHAMASDFGIGARLPRLEDARFLEGRGQFCADIKLPGTLHAAFVRSPHAHARILAVRKPRGLEDCIYLAQDLTGVGRMRSTAKLPGFKPSDWPILAAGKVRHVGEPIAMVLGSTRAEAEDFAALVEVDFETLPPVVTMADALKKAPPFVHDEWGDNVLVDIKLEAGDLNAAKAAAVHVVERKFRMNRMHPLPLEGRACVAAYDSRLDELVVYVAHQLPVPLQIGLAQVLGVSQRRLRVVVPDVGASFGLEDLRRKRNRVRGLGGDAAAPSGAMDSGSL